MQDFSAFNLFRAISANKWDLPIPAGPVSNIIGSLANFNIGLWMNSKNSYIASHASFIVCFIYRITSYNVCYTKLLRSRPLICLELYLLISRITSYNVCYTKLLRTMIKRNLSTDDIFLTRAMRYFELQHLFGLNHQ